ncbi:S9 family peptidase [Nocardioides mesophilus]|uniref:S9 family peptidase n=1 Tax=Nocardioides mesophilus TaxID=433659 RepID=A0A7G9RBP4_9ACTN|nr:S9 family peptidase [Nocardioides mesophilus]QNN53019.1 S9 family peptidase [Nocardioides mesophilus]
MPVTPALPDQPDSTDRTERTERSASPGAGPDDVRRPEPPVARTVPATRTFHGDTVIDEYEWLRSKDDPEVLAYLEAENAYTEARTGHLAGLRERIFEEIRSRTQETDLSVPARIGRYWYYSRTVEGQQYGLSCRCPAQGPDDWTPPRLSAGVDVPGEEVLLDVNELAAGHDFFSLGTASVSPDGSLLAYSTDTVGNERFTLKVKDLGTGTLLADEIPNILGPAVWDHAGTTLFYTTVDDSWRPDKVWRHRLGTPVADDVLVHHEADERFWTSIGRSRSDRLLVIGSGSKTTTEYRVLDADDPTGEFRVVAPRRQGVEYGVVHAVIGGEDCLLVLHNEDALNYQVSRAPWDATSADQWEPLIPHDPAVRLEDVDAFAGHLVISQRSDGLTQLRIIELTEEGLGEDYLIPFDEPVYTVGAGSNPEFHQPTVRLGYTTMATPPAVYDYDVASRELRLLKQTPVLGDFDPDRYEQHRLWATADDGVRVPISMVCPTDAPRDGTMPVLLYGYGSYEDSMDPYFTISRLSLLDRGVGFAIAHVRGGGEMGRQWYDEGKMLHKRNTFTDFVACARHLADEGWTAADRLVAEGGSAGGLLMGAVANLAPEAFAGIVADVAFVDPLTSILDPTLPLTVIEWEEWGNPLEDPEVYAYMKSYSPYENVEAKRYPPILAETSLNDTRVLYVEPAKWVARLRATALNPEDVLLKIEMSAGHGGVSGRYNAWRDRAFSLAWILDRLGRA